MSEANVDQPDLGGITSKVAHDLKGLLTRVVANLELLHHQRLDDRGLRQLKRAEDAAWQAEQVIRDCPRLPVKSSC